MAQTKVSSKYQVVIPKEIRDEARIEKGQVLQVVAKNGVITLVPDRGLGEMRGFLEGMKTEGVREKEDRH